MPSPVPPDYRNYNGFRAGAQYAKPVARLLFNSVPTDATSDEKKALRIVVEIADEVQAVLAERDRFSTARIQPFRNEFKSYWGGLHDILAAKARLGEGFGDVGVRAQRLIDAYFPEGVSFVNLDSYAAWFEGQRRLDRMAEEEAMAELEALASPQVVQAIKKSTAALAEAIGVGKTPRSDVPSATAVQETMAKFSRAVGAYTRLLAAKVDEADADSIERFRRAVAPIDEYRSMRGKGGTEPEEPAEPEPTEPAVGPAMPSPFTE